MGTINFPSDTTVNFQGTVRLPDSTITTDNLGTSFACPVAKMAQVASAIHVIPLTDFRTHDALGTPLPSAGANDDLGLVSGTYGTQFMSLQTADTKSASATYYGRTMLVVPSNYEDGETIQIDIYCGQLTTVADTTATVDVQAYSLDDGVTADTDLCTTAAQSCKSLTFATKSFVLDASSITAGQHLDLRIALAIVDGATGTPVISAISKIALVCDTRG